MNLRNTKRLKTLRRQLRRQATPAETALWQGLRKQRLKGCKFKRQYSVGPYILDLYCPQEALAVELDGAIHDEPNRQDYDDTRTAFLEAHGIKVIRFENQEVFGQPDIVLEAIAWHFSNDVVEESPSMKRRGTSWLTFPPNIGTFYACPHY